MIHNRENEEILDLVDASDTVIGTIARGDSDKLGPDVGYIRAAEAFIVNSHVQLWVPKRTLAKKISPGGYDFACAEHVGAGETYDEAIVRGFAEELNLAVTTSDLTFLGILPPSNDVYYFRAIYLFRTDEAPNYNPDDFTGFEWLTPDEIRANIAQGVPAKSTIPEALNLLERKI